MQPWRSWIYRSLEHEQFLFFTGMDWPPVPSRGDIEYTADLIGALRRAYCDRFNDASFFVMIHPRGGDAVINERLVSALERRGIMTLDYHRLLDYPDARLTFSDHHPTPFCNAIVAKKLVEDLDLARNKSHRLAAPLPGVN